MPPKLRLSRVSRVAFFCAAAVIVGLTALPAASDQDPVRRFEERVEVSEVLLDVLVTDRSGTIIAGLDKDDFIVEEDGKQVELTSATFYTTRYGAEIGVATAPNEVPASRHLIFFFDDLRLEATSDSRLLRQQLDAGRQSREWIDEEMGGSDWVAVASYDVKLKIHQDFTQNRDALRRAISAAVRGRDPEKDRSTRSAPAPPTQPSLLRNLPQGKELRRKTTRIYDGLRLLAEATGHIVGRKNLLLFSIGFGRFEGFSPVALPDRRYYPALEEALNANNVAVYPIDLTPTNTEHAQSHFLNILAADTGGYYYQHFVSFLTPLREIASESTGYYLLSYRSEHPSGESGYREVKVRTRARHLQVRAPRGYRFGS